MKTNLLRFFGIIVLSVAVNAAFGQWVVYEGQVTLENAGWAKDRTTEGKTDGPTSVLAAVVDDPDIEGNKLLKMEDLVGDQRESWKLEWNVADPNTGLTVVLRSKPTEGILESAPTNGFAENKFLYITPRNGAFHDALAYWYPDDLSFAQSGLAHTTTDYDWIIYRITLKADQIALYLNEDPTPVLSGPTPKTTSNNFMLYGDNTPEPYGNYLDWMVYDLSGAYAPGEGTALPETLTGLPGSSSIKRIILEDESLTIYPNPVSSDARISYEVKAAEVTSLDLYDVTGKHVMNLMNEVRQPGKYEARADFTSLRSGMYVCKLTSGKSVSLSKLIVE